MPETGHKEHTQEKQEKLLNQYYFNEIYYK